MLGIKRAGYSVGENVALSLNLSPMPKVTR